MFKSMLYPQSSKIIPLKELENPYYLIANKDLLLIQENHKVRMYAMKDFKLVKNIGRKGEGPGEFRGSPYPQILSDSIMISSAYKVSFFDFSGNLIKEKKTRIIYPVKKINSKYVSASVKRGNDDFYLSYNLYDADFKKEKVLYKGKWSIHKNRKRDLFEIYFFDVHDNKIIFAHREGFQIEVLDEKGNNLHTIKMAPPKIPFTDKDMKQIFEDMEINFKNKGYVQSMKKRGIKPEYYPDIRTCRAADGKIYVVTYLKENERSECLIFTLKGQQLKRTFIPLRDTSPINMSPFTIYNNHLYQLIENFDEEQWQLVIDPID
ncbi:hypothetical protein ACFLQP_01450 [Acidobacteriota bacterium]